MLPVIMEIIVILQIPVLVVIRMIIIIQLTLTILVHNFQMIVCYVIQNQLGCLLHLIMMGNIFQYTAEHMEEYGMTVLNVIQILVIMEFLLV